MNAFVFPGQGSQYSGMGKELAENFAVARQTFQEASDALGMDVARLCFAGTEDELKLTANTQPAIVTTSVAALRVLQAESGVTADFAAGHSLGEYAALVCAGSLAFADAVQTVRQRGLFMQDAVPVGVGTMAAIMGLEREDLDAVCRVAAQGQVCAPANYNSPGQIVIAGHIEAIDRACILAKEKGAKRALPLPVSAPFHCSLMSPAGDRLRQVLDQLTVHPFSLPVVTNVEALPNTNSSRVCALLVRQVSAPVLWDASVAWMAGQGVTRFIEIGPGKVLGGLIKRIAKGSETQNIEDIASLQALG